MPFKYRISDYLSDCLSGLEDLYNDLEFWQASLDHWEHGEIQTNDHLFDSCENSYNRLQIFSHSFLGRQTESFEKRLKQFSFPLDTVSTILMEISSQTASARDRLKSKNPYQSEGPILALYLQRIHHAVDCLFEMSPVLLNPVPTINRHPKDALVSIELPEPSATHPGQYNMTEPPSAIDQYSTLFLVSNSVTLQGWHWEVAAQIIYQSSQSRLRHSERAPKVRFTSRSAGIPSNEMDITDALDIFSSRVPEADNGGIDSLDECLARHTSRFSYSQKPLRLQLIVIMSDDWSPHYRTIERGILQSGKKLRHLGATPGEVVIHFIQTKVEPVMKRDLDALRECINADQALLGTIGFETTEFDIFNVSQKTYENIILSGLSESSSPSEDSAEEDDMGRKSFEVLWEIGVRGLSPFTDATTLHLGFKSFGHIDTLALFQYIEEPAHDGLYSARVVYDHKEDAEIACVAMNTARFDGEFISVYMIGALTKLQATQVGREDKAVTATFGLP
ncbi:hypothetical protein BBP40_000380 [Aspergillus hancockii]|nr:hypothetical protein BBP40_000380 [Aspergillus hancockii]